MSEIHSERDESNRAETKGTWTRETKIDLAGLIIASAGLLWTVTHGLGWL